MKDLMTRRFWGLLVFCGLLCFAITLRAQTNTFYIDTPNDLFYYEVLGPGLPDPPIENNPTLEMRAGNTYVLSISAYSDHPVDIITNFPFYPWSDSYYSGADSQVVSQGDITITIPATNYPSTLYYVCDQHGFKGDINVLPPLPNAPPQNIIIAINVTSTNITIKSSGTDTSYNLVPEYSSNLLSGTWLPVAPFTNVFANGTNTTTFGRLDPVCGSNVFLRISQRPPQ